MSTSPVRAPVRAATIAHADRLFPADLSTRMIARRLYESVRSLPIVCAPIQAEARWFAENAPFANPTLLFVSSDAAVLRSLSSHGVTPDQLGIVPANGGPVETDAKEIWRRFAENYHLLRGSPIQLWHSHVFSTLFGLNERLSLKTADAYYNRIGEALAQSGFRPNALFDRFGIEAAAVAAAPTDDLKPFAAAKTAGLKGRLVPCYCPDAVADPEPEHFLEQLDLFGQAAACDTRTWSGYLDAHRNRRAAFKAAGAFATAHRHATMRTSDLEPGDAERLFAKIVARDFTPAEADVFRGQVLTEMARMSLDDGLALQLFPGVAAHCDPAFAARYGADLDFSLPRGTEYAEGLQALLNRFGHEPKLSVLAFAPEGGAVPRDLVQLARHYRALALAPGGGSEAPEALRAFRAATAAGTALYKGVQALARARFIAIPAQADIARRADCAVLAELVAAHRLEEEEAYELAKEFAYGLVKRAYRL